MTNNMLRLMSFGQDRIPACRLVCLRRSYAVDPKKRPKKVESYYDVLNVRSDCSTNDIRNAFVKLSKQYHPDMQESATKANTEHFVKISEAYQTLIKPQARKEYDRSLMWGGENPLEPNIEHRPWEVRPNYSANPGPYYGIRGLKRVSNWKVALFLIALGIIGAIFGFSSVKHSFELSRQIQDEISAEATTHHATVVADAQKYGNEEQIRRMVERLGRDSLSRVASK